MDGREAPLRVLVLGQRFHPAKTVAAVRWSALADHLPDTGIDVKVVCQRYPGDGLGLDDRVALEIHRGEVQSGITSNVASVAEEDSRTRTRRARSITTVSRLLLLPTSSLAWFRRWRDVRRVVRRERPDVLVATSPPADLNLFAVLLARKMGLPLVLDLRDPYVGSGWYDWPRVPPWRQAIRALERWYVNSAEAVLVAGALHADEMRSRYPDRASRIHLIPNGFHPGGPSRSGRADGMASEHDDPIVLGVVASAPQPELEIIARGARIAWPDRTIRLHSFGLPSEVVDCLRSEIEVVDCPWVPPPELGSALDAADILLLVLSPSRALAGGTSTKLYQYLDRGIPILAVNPYAADVALLERWAFHHVVRQPTEIEVAAGLNRLLAGGSAISLDEFRATYGWPSLAARVSDVLRRATAGAAHDTEG